MLQIWRHPFYAQRKFCEQWVDTTELDRRLFAILMYGVEKKGRKKQEKKRLGDVCIPSLFLYPYSFYQIVFPSRSVGWRTALPLSSLFRTQRFFTKKRKKKAVRCSLSIPLLSPFSCLFFPVFFLSLCFGLSCAQVPFRIPLVFLSEPYCFSFLLLSTIRSCCSSTLARCHRYATLFLSVVSFSCALPYPFFASLLPFYREQPYLTRCHEGCMRGERAPPLCGGKEWVNKQRSRVTQVQILRESGYTQKAKKKIKSCTCGKDGT